MGPQHAQMISLTNRALSCAEPPTRYMPVIWKVLHRLRAAVLWKRTASVLVSVRSPTCAMTAPA